MKKLRWRIEYESDIIKKLFLKLPRNCTFKILNTFYTYNWDDEGVYVLVSTYINDDSEYEIGYKNIRESNYILSYLYSINIGLNNEMFMYKTAEVESVDNYITECSNPNLSKLININECIIQMDKKTYKYFIKCVEFYSKGLEYHYNLYINEEALLCLFKSIELIALSYSKSNIESVFDNAIKKHFYEIIKETFNESYDRNFHSEAYKSVRYTMFKLLNLKRKIKFTIKGIEMEDCMCSYEIDELIEFRNRILAHSNLNEVNSDDLLNYLGKSMMLSRQMISKFFFARKYNEISLNLDVEYWE